MTVRCSALRILKNALYDCLEVEGCDTVSGATDGRFMKAATMRRVKENKARERRIEMDIVVDAYNSEEQLAPARELTVDFLPQPSDADS